jgi:hypothetical protein
VNFVSDFIALAVASVGNGHARRANENTITDFLGRTGRKERDNEASEGDAE